MNTPTPGEWLVCKHGTPEYAPQYGIYTEASPSDFVIVRGKNAKADAQAISALHELLKSLQDVVLAFPDLDKFEDCNGESLAPLAAKIHAAIAKALGN